MHYRSRSPRLARAVAASAPHIQVEALEGRQLLAANPIISEFMAANTETLRDGEGRFSDWIEIHNAGDAAVNLDAYSLTDDPSNLRRWSFPNITLQPKQFLLVFASGQPTDSYTDPKGFLHTNFRLNEDGEYLALVGPDSQIISEFGPNRSEFPNQRNDVSYGIAQNITPASLIPIGAPASIFIPPDGSLGTAWTQPSFIPGAGWINGSTAIGYDVSSTPGGGGTSGQTVLSVDFNASGNPSLTQAGFSPFVTSAGTTPVTQNFTGGLSVTVSGIGAGHDVRTRANPTDAGAFTQSALMRDFIFSSDRAGSGGLDVLIQGLVPGQAYTLKAWSLDDLSPGNRASDWFANGVVAAEDYTFDGNEVPPSPSSNDRFSFNVTTVASASGQILLSGRRDSKSVGSGGAADFGVFLNGFQVTTAAPPPQSFPVLQLDFNSRTSAESGEADTEAGFTPVTLDDNGSIFNGVKVTISPVGAATLEDRDRAQPVDAGALFTQDQLYDDFIFANSSADGEGLEILLEGLTPGQQYDLTLWSFDRSTSGTRISDWIELESGEALSIEEGYNFDGIVSPTQNGLNTVNGTVTASSTGTLRIRGVRAGGAAGSAVFLNALRLSQPGIRASIVTDVGTQMHNVNASAYVRLPFTAPATTFEELKLRLQYDAGFVAYLNGTEILRRNAPGSAGQPLAFNDAATAERTNGQAVTLEEFDLSSLASLLMPGTQNVLAIQGLNSAAGDVDFLLSAELVGTDIDLQGARYMLQPTPGARNTGGVIGFVGDTRFSGDPASYHGRGFYDAPFDVRLSTSTPGATLIYTLDGSAPSLTNGVKVPAASALATPEAVVPITRTTLLRTAAFKADFAASNVDTQTYIFLSDVLTQNPASGPGTIYPATWTSSGGTFPADYAMDPEVVAAWPDNPNDNEFGIREGMQSIPTMSIVMNHGDLWSAANGLYTHPEIRSKTYERPASVEYFDPRTGQHFQVDAGIQMHGAASADNLRTKKHSFRLLFRDDFGPGRLEFPLFSDTDNDEFNTLVLRAFFTDSFATRTQTNRYNPLIATYLRDVWMRDSHAAMGYPETHNTYVHLYINGLYWGLYNPTERPDDAFLETYVGGAAEDWDIIKDFNELFRGNRTAWDQMHALANAGLSTTQAYNRIQGLAPDGTDDPNLPNYLDVDNLIDFMLLHIFSGVEDWPSHNWYAARPRTGETKGFQFFVWDQEIALDTLYRDRTDVSDANTPARLYSQLRQNAEFRLRFADRVQHHLFNGGALSTEVNRQRWLERAAEIEAAIIGESARWGDAREGETITPVSGQTAVVPTLTLSHWRANRDQVANQILPQLPSLFLSRLRTDGLFPNVSAPSFSQHGGEVPEGFALNITAPAGTIYYTLDGSDPRLPGGQVSPSAIAFNGSIPLSADITVKARVLNNNVWSALLSAPFFVSALASPANVRITEVMYNPPAPSDEEIAAGFATRGDFEYIEIHNAGNRTINLAGSRLSGNVDFTFGDLKLRPGEYAVVVSNPAAFRLRYGNDALIAGTFADAANLSDNGGTLRLRTASNALVHEFQYDDEEPWPGRADGNGSSLEVANLSGNYALGRTWRSSIDYAGSPGRAGSAPITSVVINEILSRSLAPALDAIELFNPTSENVNIGGWYISDSNDNYRKFRLPDNTILPAGGYLLLDEDDFNADPTHPNSFSFDGVHGDDLWIVKASSTGNLLAFADSVHFDAADVGQTYGRWPNGSGRFYPMDAATLGAANATPHVGPAVISEVMYHHPSENPDLNYLEIYNRGETPLDLSGWQVDGGVDFTFPAGASLTAFGTALILPFNPAKPENASRVAAFRAAYGIEQSTPLFGGFSGQLDGAGDRLRLLRPGTPPQDEPNFKPLLFSDEVGYLPSAPWPDSPDGGGTSLTRTANAGVGDAAGNWVGASPTPGGHTTVLLTHTRVENLTLRKYSVLRLEGSRKTLEVSSLVMHPGALIDLGDGAMVIHNGDPGAIGALLAAGRGSTGGVASGKWNGTSGITSSTARAASAASESRVVGFAVNGQLPVRYQSFGGVDVNGDDVLIRFTKNGDANLDGVVNNNDITILAGFYRPGVAGKHWHHADFNYDGFVDNNDITILAGFYAPNEAPVAPATASAEPLPAAPAAAATPVAVFSSGPEVKEMSKGTDLLGQEPDDVLA